MTEIRLIFFSDTHLGVDFPIRPRIERRRRGHDFFANFHRILDYAREQAVDLVIHGGDLFNRSKPPLKVANLAFQGILDFLASGIDFYLIPGNHERSRIPDTMVFQHDKAHLFDQPRTYVFEKEGLRLAIAGFPFIRKGFRDTFGDCLEETGWQTPEAHGRLLCLHQSVEGARVGPKNFTFRAGPEVISRNSIPDEFLAVLCGHIHRQQILEPGPFLYCGSTERTTFAEKNEEKGFFDLRLGPDEQGKLVLRKINFRPLPTRPMVDLLIDGAISKEALEGFLRSEAAKIDPNAVVRLLGTRPLDREVQTLLTQQFLRSVFPQTMNVQASGNLFST